MIKRFRVLLFLLGLLIGGSAMIAATGTTAQAKTSLRYFPTALRRTWYHYEDGHYSRITFGYKHMRTTDYYDGSWHQYTTKIHVRNLNATHVSHHPSWMFATLLYAHKMHWVNLYGWNQGAGDGDFYGVKIRHYRGYRIRTLSIGGGASLWTSGHYYATRKVARNLGTHHFSGVLYYPDF
jgi:hypothetical protein